MSKLIELCIAIITVALIVFALKFIFGDKIDLGFTDEAVTQPKEL